MSQIEAQDGGSSFGSIFSGFEEFTGIVVDIAKKGKEVDDLFSTGQPKSVDTELATPNPTLVDDRLTVEGGTGGAKFAGQADTNPVLSNDNLKLLAIGGGVLLTVGVLWSVLK